MSDDFSQFQDAFFEEAGDHVAAVEEGLLALEQHPEDLDLLNKIFRSAHSIKGTSGMFGFNAVAQFTHKMETLLDLLRNGEKVVTPQIADLLLKSTDCLKTLIDAAKSGLPVDDDSVQRLTIELASASAAGSQPLTQVTAKAATGSSAPSTATSLSVTVPRTPHALFTSPGHHRNGSSSAASTRCKSSKSWPILEHYPRSPSIRRSCRNWQPWILKNATSPGR
ncbi:MAG: hypothetical protein E8D41_08965 [Nitrospira sp.]|nr:MAG: hypothetical protein E8D41_08965 [Nitrospira sp.]